MSTCHACGIADGDKGAIVRQAAGEPGPTCAECRGLSTLRFGYAGANSVDGTTFVALEVNGVEDGNVYLTADTAEHLLYSLLSAGVELSATSREALA